MQRLLEHLETLWDRVQVEHKGSYSVERMQSVKKYSEETSLVRALSVLIFTPIPCLVAVLCTDCFKLASLAEGVSHSQLLWLRTAMVNFFISWTQIKRCHRFVTGLPETPRFDLAASWALALSTTGFLWVLALSIDFPLPFASLVGGIGWWTLAVPLFFIRFGSFVRASPEISHQTKLFTWSIVSEMNTVSLYSVYTVVFVGLGVNEQIAFSLLLPIMKIASKNITRRLFQHKEDLIPEVVVFTTEMFHSLFLVIFLQNSRSIGTTFVLMAVDVACSLLAIRDVQTILDRNIERCATAYAAKSGIPMVVRSLLPVAAYILNKPDVTVHESGIRLLSEASQLFAIRPTQVAPTASALQSLATPDSKQQETRESTLSWMRPAITTEERAFADSLSKQDQRLIVRDILKLLHLTEFLLLIEFVEIVVPVVYCTYAIVCWAMAVVAVIADSVSN